MKTNICSVVHSGHFAWRLSYLISITGSAIFFRNGIPVSLGIFAAVVFVPLAGTRYYNAVCNEPLECRT